MHRDSALKNVSRIEPTSHLIVCAQLSSWGKVHNRLSKGEGLPECFQETQQCQAALKRLKFSEELASVFHSSQLGKSEIC